MRWCIILAALLCLTACDGTTPEGTSTGSGRVDIWRDAETRCDYVLYHTAYGAGITPRLDATGKPMCSKP